MEQNGPIQMIIKNKGSDLICLHLAIILFSYFSPADGENHSSLLENGVAHTVAVISEKSGV